jgi:protein ImuB
MRLVALDARASAHGLHVGQTLADARAILPELDAQEIDRAAIAQLFADFADWHSNASPIVSVLTDAAPWGDLVLDITGVSHLFGGESAMLARLTGRLAALGIAAQGAVASTVGAAWALAHHAPGRVAAAGAEAAALARLPVEALRLGLEQTEALRQFGLKAVGQLYGRDRRALQARFGATLLLRLDQALGWLEERVAPRLPAVDYAVERRFPEPIGLLEDVLLTAQDLAITLALRLEALGVGAQAFHLFLYRVDHKLMTLSVNAARATRDPGHVGRLFSYRAERLGGEYDAGFGIDMIRLAASSIGPLEAVQSGAFGSDDGAASLDGLYDRMSSRLGALAVLRSRPVNTHVPEQSVRLEPAIAPSPAPAEPPPPIRAPRPLRLLPQPEPITVLAEVPDAPPSRMVWRRVGYRFVKASGPERLGADWRQSSAPLGFDAAAPTGEPVYREGEEARDYYVAEDEGGRRFWLFRLGLLGIAAEPRWYLHGFFA